MYIFCNSFSLIHSLLQRINKEAWKTFSVFFSFINKERISEKN